MYADRRSGGRHGGRLRPLNDINLHIYSPQADLEFGFQEPEKSDENDSDTNKEDKTNDSRDNEADDSGIEDKNEAKETASDIDYSSNSDFWGTEDDAEGTKDDAEGTEDDVEGTEDEDINNSAKGETGDNKEDDEEKIEGLDGKKKESNADEEDDVESEVDDGDPDDEPDDPQDEKIENQSKNQEDSRTVAQIHNDAATPFHKWGPLPGTIHDLELGDKDEEDEEYDADDSSESSANSESISGDPEAMDLEWEVAESIRINLIDDCWTLMIKNYSKYYHDKKLKGRQAYWRRRILV